MTTKLLQRRLDRLRLAGSSRPIVIEMPVGESLAQARKRAQTKHGDLSARDVVIIERTTDSKDEK